MAKASSSIQHLPGQALRVSPKGMLKCLQVLLPNKPSLPFMQHDPNNLPILPLPQPGQTQHNR